MPSFNTVIVSTLVDVETRLEDFGVTRQQIMAIGQTARAYGDDASPSMPLNAAGMLSYIHGVGELRQQLVGPDYVPDRTCGIEAVVKRDRTVRIGFQNVDKCCVNMPPLPRSEKGSGAESLSGPDLFVNAGMKPGPLTAVLKDGIRTYYVMVGLDGSVELSCPVIEKGKFVHWMERIYIYSPDSDWEADPQTDTGPIEDFDITVSFKH
ncbi:conserved hypothetical protein [Roseovarius sp. EC-HK134]|uniref:hypothetical protein n=1 Tax=unclassified Roseovarius TaxID=2614913 RepID=UPI00125B1DF2|nr:MULTISPECIES: hypothetical protein [unclassified Roseovarius]VVT01774.1 conserved hypothetical protein [Roseovarius sp. EC-HK134]VVT02505.1 conserved hypothetical protein [Roseovarius sp. EC-SD190]